MIVMWMCVAYGFTMGGISMTSLRGRIDPKRALHWMTRISAVWLPLCLVAVTVRAGLDTPWLLVIIAPLALIGICLGYFLWRFDDLVRRDQP